MFKGGFIQNLPKIYGLYTGGFAVFIILMAIAEMAGVSAKNIGVMFVVFTVGIYAFIGYLSRTVQVDAYWAKTKNHMIVTLVIWAFFSLVIFMFGTELNTMSFLGYPLAYYMTAQGSLLAFVIMLFWTANKQEKIDEEHGFSEREED
jgi:putative solute:sodium symporter small subunit